ncbi:MAG: hypothetical protein H6793_03045 [Candidatus Nomurabacteria bacterium]|nr:hypothetical protein [Candidatus Saccharibacteria bacterium]USN95284.1 MAG: hypothetical protein H6793_03045 [Candidatus Nomurabacteria bacterium]
MKEAKMSDDDQKHLDATKPGLLPVSHTSKPALVNNQQLSKDPMMRDEDKKDDKPELSKKSLVLEPTITKESLKKDETQLKDESQPKEVKEEELPDGVIENQQPVVDERSEEIERLINEKKYYLPIKSKSSTPMIIGVIIGGVVLVGILALLFIIVL